MLQALNVNAEGDGHGAQRTLSSPRGGGRLALPWGGILGIILGGLVVAGLATAVLARRRVRRAYQVCQFLPFLPFCFPERHKPSRSGPGVSARGSALRGGHSIIGISSAAV